jgi:hypothetical protein
MDDFGMFFRRVLGRLVGGSRKPPQHHVQESGAAPVAASSPKDAGEKQRTSAPAEPALVPKADALATDVTP